MPDAVEALQRVIIRESRYKLAWVARDGTEAVERCGGDTPDLVLMELMMSVTDGAETTRRIMNETPCPILIVTSAIEAHAAKIFQALGSGALDAVQIPLPGESGQAADFAALKFKINKIGRVGPRDDSSSRPDSSGQNPSPSPSEADDCLIAIGASAGGPAALAAILSTLPRDFPAAIIIIQHVDAQFVPSMALWLNETSAVFVRPARHGDTPQANVALIAGTDNHLTFTNSRLLGYTSEPRDCLYHPSVDVFFQSVVSRWRGRAAGVLLTGMGRDGAKGLKAMRDAGFMTIAQDAPSSVVYGMPKAAAELHAAKRILPLNEIARGLITFVAASTRTLEKK